MACVFVCVLVCVCVCVRACVRRTDVCRASAGLCVYKWAKEERQGALSSHYACISWLYVSEFRSVCQWMDGWNDRWIDTCVGIRTCVCVCVYIYIYVYLYVCILTCPHVRVSSSPLCVRVKFTNQIRNMPYLISWPTFAGST